MYGHARWISRGQRQRDLSRFARQQIYGTLAKLQAVPSHFDLILSGRHHKEQWTFANKGAINKNLRRGGCGAKQ
jgi:hypothetical protein